MKKKEKEYKQLKGIKPPYTIDYLLQRYVNYINNISAKPCLEKRPNGLSEVDRIKINMASLFLGDLLELAKGINQQATINKLANDNDIPVSFAKALLGETNDDNR